MHTTKFIFIFIFILIFIFIFHIHIHIRIHIHFDVNIIVDEQILLIGYDTQNKEMIIPNIILAFAQYTIYRVNMLCKFKPKQFNSFSLFSEFKQDLIMNLKFIEKRNIIKITDNQLLDRLYEHCRI